MREFTLSANIKLLTLNKAFVALKNGRRVRSKEYVKFSRLICGLMLTRNIEFKVFNSLFEPKKHEVHATLRVGVAGMITKAGTISKTSGDLANLEKCLLDNVLTGKVDDSSIVMWDMSKYESDIDCFELTLEIVDR